MTITDQPECSTCGGACCEPERLEFPVPKGVTMRNARRVLTGMGLPDARPLEVRVNEHGRTVIRTDCPRCGTCDPAKRPAACLVFPANYLDDDHTDAEREEIAEFCALFRRLRDDRD